MVRYRELVAIEAVSRESADDQSSPLRVHDGSASVHARVPAGARRRWLRGGV
ncbi:protein of unknown function [Candidatus Nitrotoga arctica]|uniref:Uncharacterized protein n=1 Tax=Candidatus Nitrotoga arctica TaxID=453162 RepID=A0ABN8AKR8_9PROT|nr:protein of unknown function [Candidatus Nitrotoga arctica]